MHRSNREALVLGCPTHPVHPTALLHKSGTDCKYPLPFVVMTPSNKNSFARIQSQEHQLANVNTGIKQVRWKEQAPGHDCFAMDLAIL